MQGCWSVLHLCRCWSFQQPFRFKHCCKWNKCHSGARSSNRCLNLGGLCKGTPAKSTHLKESGSNYHSFASASLDLSGHWSDLYLCRFWLLLQPFRFKPLLQANVSGVCSPLMRKEDLAAFTWSSHLGLNTHCWCWHHPALSHRAAFLGMAESRFEKCWGWMTLLSPL